MWRKDEKKVERGRRGRGGWRRRIETERKHGEGGGRMERQRKVREGEKG